LFTYVIHQVGLLNGKNFGKLVVKLNDDPTN